MDIKISDIKIKKRIRRDIGDLSLLKESLLNNGLINPVTLNEKKELLAGFRRLQAAKELGWNEIECRIVHARTKIEKLTIEADENMGRKDFTDEELMILAEEREYLSSRGFKKVLLWLKRMYKKLVQLITGLFSARA